MGEVVLVVGGGGGGSFRVHSVEESPAREITAAQLPGREANPNDAWLPITESRNGNVFTAISHLVCSGVGFQALLLPFAFSALGWAWGITCLSLAFVWQLYTSWLLVNLHESESESESGVRFSRYVHLSTVAFGQKFGKILAIFPVMYLSGGTCAMTIISGGGAMKLFQSLVNSGVGGTAVSTVGLFLVFTCAAVLLSQFTPNLNSVARVSFIGSVTAVVYFTLLWALPISLDRPADVSHHPLTAEMTGFEKFAGVLNGVGIILLSFKGHNLILEIQATLPSNSKHRSKAAMWRGVQISYLQVALCLFPIAIGGFWAYGNQIPATGGMLRALAKFHEHDISKELMGFIYFLIIINCISTFQVYSMVVFDNLESKYVAKKNRPCPMWLRAIIRLLFGGLVCFVAVTFPFLGSLASLVGGLTMPLTYVYPCLMWISIKKTRPRDAMWLVNVTLGLLGVIFSILVVIAAVWNLTDQGLEANFFKP